MTFIKYLASSAALFCLCSCDSDQYVLAFNTENAPVQTYHLESNLNSILPMDSTTTSPEAMNTHLQVRASNSMLTSYDDGSAKFELKVDSVDYKSDKRTVEEFREMEKAVSTENFQYKMAKDGMISSAILEDSLTLGSEALNLVRLFLKIQPILPGKAVAVGETWERPTEIPGRNGNTTVYKTFTFQDYYIHDGVQMARVGMNLKYRETADSTSDVLMESNGFILGSGDILFDITHGVLVNASIELSGDLKMNDIVSGSIIPDMHVIQKIKLRSEF
ncbi:hypothetical protein [Fibrobacter sp. UWEL]|uniref:hypothetical protein n=1 Tax=Fibrobacter sp. UWEL TaxID=1896209 RepID=UPI0009115FA3|nr:hypothetical protein [Fibrobacter sp. UWEL]SHK32510.1 hypothetical protein SAMN05720468_101117 [Fibrobacter sp. UWEL]